MVRIKRGIVSKRRHKKVFAQTKGFIGTKSRLIKDAKEALLHKGAYSYVGRKNRKRDFRRLWIIRISEAVKQEGLSYSVLMNKLKKANVLLDRKILSDLVLNDRETFKRIVDNVRNI